MGAVFLAVLLVLVLVLAGFLVLAGGGRGEDCGEVCGGCELARVVILVPTITVAG